MQNTQIRKELVLIISLGHSSNLSTVKNNKTESNSKDVNH